MADLVNYRTLSPRAALEMVLAAEDKAKGLKLQKGYFVVVGAKDPSMLLASAAFGSAGLLGMRIALAKVRTVMATGRPTHVQANHMKEEGINLASYAGAIETQFGGGLMVYADAEHTEPVGAVAYSGGEEWQNIEVCQYAVAAVRLFTD